MGSLSLPTILTRTHPVHPDCGSIALASNTACPSVILAEARRILQDGQIGAIRKASASNLLTSDDVRSMHSIPNGVAKQSNARDESDLGGQRHMSNRGRRRVFLRRDRQPRRGYPCLSSSTRWFSSRVRPSPRGNPDQPAGVYQASQLLWSRQPREGDKH